jgi:hypothetical protein
VLTLVAIPVIYSFFDDLSRGRILARTAALLRTTWERLRPARARRVGRRPAGTAVSGALAEGSIAAGDGE